MPTFSCENETCPQSKLSSRTLVYNTRQFTAAVAAVPSVVPLLVLGDGIIGKVCKRNSTPLDRDRHTGNQIVAAAGVAYEAVCSNATDLFLLWH